MGREGRKRNQASRRPQSGFAAKRRGAVRAAQRQRIAGPQSDMAKPDCGGFMWMTILTVLALI